MKVVVSASGETLESRVENVFARCAYFIVAEIENKKIKNFEPVKNLGKDQMGGAGVSAAQTVAEKNASAVISGNIGPRAFDVLKQFKIEVYIGKGTVKEALQNFIDNKLEKFSK